MNPVLQGYWWSLQDSHMAVLARWIVLSLLVHVLLLAWSPRPRFTSDEKPVPPPLTVQLRSAPQEPAAAPVPPAPAAPEPDAVKPQPRALKKPAPPPREANPREAKPRDVPREPVIALAKPAPADPVQPVVPPPAPEPAETPPAAPVLPPLTTPPPAETDLTAFIEARRRARGEGVDTPAAETERANRAALANASMKPAAPLNFEAPKPTHSGGVFQIRRRGYDYAEFMFYGWNENFRREGPQLIEVRKGDSSDIDIAVIRKIIEIIRHHERGDFKWYSKRTGKTLTLSARARDNAGLEEFMMQEFREDLHRYR